MDFSRMKTLMILLLLLTNLILGGILFARAYQGYEMERTAVLSVLSALSDMGVSADEETVTSGTPEIRVVDIERNPDEEASLVGALLGPAQVIDQGGNIFYYTGENGYASFRSAGRFEMGLSKPFSVSGDGEEAAHEVLDAMGVPADGMTFVTTRTSYGTHVEIVQSILSYPVMGHSFSMSFDERGLFELSGTLLCGETRTLEISDIKTPDAVLLRFAAEMRREGRGETRVYSVEMGYMPTASAPGVTRISPVYLIRTDRGDYIADAATVDAFVPAT